MESVSLAPIFGKRFREGIVCRNKTLLSIGNLFSLRFRSDRNFLDTIKDGMAKRNRIEKQSWKPGNILSPAPPVLVSCGGTQEWKPNLITIAWAGNVCSDPPMLSISVRPERYSFQIIRTTREFVVNVPSLRQARVVDWCGVVSGRDEDKFSVARLTPAPALKVCPPIVRECPLNIECRVQESLELGSHTMFVAQVVAVQVSSDLVDGKGQFRLDKCGLLAFANGQYFNLGSRIGRFGFSVRKRGGESRR
jgi:flavin reductase (DIM6/NTAB) family NADH-FMN oxidoreductase RutF